MVNRVDGEMFEECVRSIWTKPAWVPLAQTRTTIKRTTIRLALSEKENYSQKKNAVGMILSNCV
jgi:hypothetical protein